MSQFYTMEYIQKTDNFIVCFSSPVFSFQLQLCSAQNFVLSIYQPSIFLSSIRSFRFFICLLLILLYSTELRYFWWIKNKINKFYDPFYIKFKSHNDTDAICLLSAFPSVTLIYGTLTSTKSKYRTILHTNWNIRIHTI